MPGMGPPGQLRDPLGQGKGVMQAWHRCDSTMGEDRGTGVPSALLTLLPVGPPVPCRIA